MNKTFLALVVSISVLATVWGTLYYETSLLNSRLTANEHRLEDLLEEQLAKNYWSVYFTDRVRAPIEHTPTFEYLIPNMTLSFTLAQDTAVIVEFYVCLDVPDQDYLWELSVDVVFDDRRTAANTIDPSSSLYLSRTNDAVLSGHMIEELSNGSHKVELRWKTEDIAAPSLYVSFRRLTATVFP